jgi:hypothetical protein
LFVEILLKKPNVVTKKILRTAGIALVEKHYKFAPKKIDGVNIKNKKATSE